MFMAGFHCQSTWTGTEVASKSHGRANVIKARIDSSPCPLFNQNG